MTLYDLDYGRWLENQITNLKQHKWEELDIPHLIEELEALNKIDTPTALTKWSRGILLSTSQLT